MTVDWVVEADNSSIGKYVYIDLWANSGNSVYFDNVNVTFTPAPEPPAVILSLVCGARIADACVVEEQATCCMVDSFLEWSWNRNVVSRGVDRPFQRL